MKPKFSLANLLLVVTLICVCVAWYFDRTRLSHHYEANTSILNALIKDDTTTGQLQLQLIKQCFPPLNTSLRDNETPKSANAVDNVIFRLNQLSTFVEAQQTRLEDAKTAIH